MTGSRARPRARTLIASLALALVTQVSVVPARATDADTIAPTQPGNFHVVSRTRSNQLTLGWDASFDAVGVAGYTLYRDGIRLGTLYQAGVDILGTVMYDRLGGRLKSPVTYSLVAFDAADNRSTPATLVVVP